MAAFHAAQAIVHDREGKVPRTHSGLQQRFALAAMSEPRLGEEMGRFLVRAYDYKDISDYRTDRTVSADEAEAVVSKAAEFIDRVAALVVS